MRDIKWTAVLTVALICAFFATCVTQCSITQRSKNQNYSDTLRMAIASGQDPVAVGCAYGFGGEGETAICVANQVKK